MASTKVRAANPTVFIFLSIPQGLYAQNKKILLSRHKVGDGEDQEDEENGDESEENRKNLQKSDHGVPVFYHLILFNCESVRWFRP